MAAEIAPVIRDELEQIKEKISEEERMQKEERAEHDYESPDDLFDLISRL